MLVRRFRRAVRGVPFRKGFTSGLTGGLVGVAFSAPLSRQLILPFALVGVGVGFAERVQREMQQKKLRRR